MPLKSSNARIIEKLNNISKHTIYFQACNKVVGFQSMGEEFIRKLVIDDKARSTHENYLRQMSKLALYFNRTPFVNSKFVPSIFRN